MRVKVYKVLEQNGNIGFLKWYADLRLDYLQTNDGIAQFDSDPTIFIDCMPDYPRDIHGLIKELMKED